MILRSMVVVAGVVVVLAMAAHAAPGLRLLPGSTGPGLNASPVSDVSDSRQPYLDRARTDMKRWESRMREWSADAAARGAEMNADARRDLDKSWATLRVDWKRLQASGGEAWAKARISFDRASNKMRSSWRTIHQS